MGDELLGCLVKPENVLVLQEIFSYHIKHGQVLAGELTNGQMITMANGKDININILDGGVVINENSAVVMSNVLANNGVIHAIDNVLIPPGLDVAGFLAECVATDPPVPEPNPTARPTSRPIPNKSSKSSKSRRLLSYPTNAELLGWEWQFGIFQSASLTTIYMIPLVLLLLSTILFCVNNNNKRRKNNNEDSDDDNDDDDDDNDIGGVISNSVVTQRSTSKKRSAVIVSGGHNKSSFAAYNKYNASPLTWLYRVFIEEGLRIETSKLNVKEILENEIQTMTQMMMRNSNNSDSYQFHRTGKLYKIHPQSSITEDDIRKVYPNLNCTIDDNNNNDTNHNDRYYGNGNGNGNSNSNSNNNADTQYYGGDSVVLFFRLASIFVSSGMSTIENQQILYKVAKALKLPPLSLLHLGLTEITVQFQLGAVVNIKCSTAAFYQLSLLSRTQQLAYHIIQNKNRNATATKRKTKSNDNDTENDKDQDQQPTTTVNILIPIPASVYLRVLDELEQDHAADPYGWLIRISAVYIVCVFAPLAVYDG